MGNSDPAFSFWFSSISFFDSGEMYIINLPFDFDDAEVRRPGADWLGVQRYLHILPPQIINVDKVVIFNCKAHVIFNL